jgi:hypothetical protein
MLASLSSSHAVTPHADTAPLCHTASSHQMSHTQIQNRERQKATISNLEAEVAQKLAELQVLSQENEVLKLRSAVLEAVTSGREYHVSVGVQDTAHKPCLLAAGWWLAVTVCWPIGGRAVVCCSIRAQAVRSPCCHASRPCACLLCVWSDAPAVIDALANCCPVAAPVPHYPDAPPHR